MGVHGLTSYVEGNQQFFTDLKLKNTNLVIDGCSLYYRLYFSSGIDQMRGGDYDVFASLVRSFFSALQSCNIRPFVVVDGGMDQTDKKFKTLRDRTQSKIREAHLLSRGSRGNILPLMSCEVFKQVVCEIAGPLVQCIAEADFEIASLAHQWKCPVLTNDSDFYIFDLPGGYLPMTFFEWQNVCHQGSGWYIPARRFTVNRFCSHFNHMNKHLLPLFAVITGNDYTPPNITEAFFSRVELQRVPRGKGSHMTTRIHGLLLWLSKYSTPVEALEDVLEILGGKQKGNTRKQLTAGVQDYQLPHISSLAHIFLSNQPVPLYLSKLPAALESQPEWLLREFMFSRLHPSVFDVLVHQKAILTAQVENSQLPSSHTASLSIRQVIYGLLLSKKAVQNNVSNGQRGRGRGMGRGGLSGPSQMSSSVCLVEEYDRLNLELRRTTVEAQLPESLPQLNLSTLDKTAVSVRLSVLLGTLGVMKHVPQALPPHLRLPVCVTYFWVHTSKPKPSHTTLQALLLGLVYGELCRRSAMSEDSLSSCALTASVCQRLNNLRINTGQRRSLDLGVAHSLSQWQSCLWAGIHLNQLLCFPLPEPQCAWLFSGTLLHGLEPVLRGGNHAESLLAGSPVAGQLYSIFFWAIMGCDVQHYAAQQIATGRQRGQGKRQQGSRGRGRGNRRTKGASADSNLSNRFGMLTCEDESDED